MEPVAWMVFCPKGHEYDYIVSANRDDVEFHADTFDDGGEHEIIPLYTAEVVQALKDKLREANHKIETLKKAARSKYRSNSDYLPHQDEDEHR